MGMYINRISYELHKVEAALTAAQDNQAWNHIRVVLHTLTEMQKECLVLVDACGKIIQDVQVHTRSSVQLPTHVLLSFCKIAVSLRE